MQDDKHRNMNKLVLKPGREKSLKRRHPWVFSGAVAKLTGDPGSGETIEVHSSDGEFLAVGTGRSARSTRCFSMSASNARWRCVPTCCPPAIPCGSCMRSPMDYP